MHFPPCFVLVHGAWHGGWCWKKLAPLLRRAECDVWTPTLPGLGERSSEGGPEIGLECHINAITCLLIDQDLKGVILVGHSYAGLVVGGVVDQIPERIRRVVYLDAYVPEHGKSLIEINGGTHSLRNPTANDWSLPSPSSKSFDVEDSADIRWADALLTPHPIKTFSDRSVLRSEAASHPGVCIWCTRQDGTFESIARACGERGWPVYTLDAGHDCMITVPDELAKILLQIASN